MVKNLPANARDSRDLGSFPGQEDSLEEEMALLYSCWENYMDRGVWESTIHESKNQPQLSN